MSANPTLQLGSWTNPHDRCKLPPEAQRQIVKGRSTARQRLGILGTRQRISGTHRAAWASHRGALSLVDYVGMPTNPWFQPNLCESELHVVDHANVKFSKGYKATGVGGVICARHSLVRKNGLGDLQKGERYAIQSELRGPVLYILSDMQTWTLLCCRP